MEIKKDINFEARMIIADHTEGMMSCTSSYEPESHMEFWEYMLSECAFILSEKFLDGNYTPMEYNAIRNELAKIINAIFNPYC